MAPSQYTTPTWVGGIYAAVPSFNDWPYARFRLQIFRTLVFHQHPITIASPSIRLSHHLYKEGNLVLKITNKTPNSKVDPFNLLSKMRLSTAIAFTIIYYAGAGALPELGRRQSFCSATAGASCDPSTGDLPCCSDTHTLMQCSAPGANGGLVWHSDSCSSVGCIAFKGGSYCAEISGPVCGQP
jgi:hypothetical protein